MACSIETTVMPDSGSGGDVMTNLPDWPCAYTAKSEGPQLALEPFDGRDTAGYVSQPLLVAAMTRYRSRFVY